MLTFQVKNKIITPSYPVRSRVDVPGISGGASPALKGLIVKGSIRCNWCLVAMDETRGVCPRCGRSTCHISWYDETELNPKKRRKRIFDDKPGVKLGYNAALDKLLEINREYRESLKPNSTVIFDIRKWTDPQDHLVKNILDVWLASKREEMESSLFSPGSLDRYSSNTKTYFKPVLGDVPIYSIETEHFKILLRAIPAKLKIAYKKSVLSTFQTFLQWCRENSYLRKDVPAIPEIRGNDSKPTQALEVEQQQEGLENIPERHRDPLEFGQETGLRASAYTCLKLTDINVFTHEYTIRRGESGKKIWEFPKNRKHKTKHLSDRAYEIAVKHMRGRQDIDGWLFINPYTEDRYTTQSVREIWRKNSKTGVPLHQAGRHSYATQMAEIIAKLGLPEHYLQELLDHSDPRTTRRYTHIRESVMKELVNQRQKIVNLRKGKK